MLLSLFRLTMIVPLLVSAVCIEANSEKSPFVPSEKDKALVEVPRESNAFAKDDAKSVDNLDQEPPLRKRQSSRNNGHSNQHDARIRSVGSVENRVARSGDGNLARKLAKEALKSPKMQQTMHKLTQGAPRKNLYATVKLPAPARSNVKLTHDGKTHGKLVRRKGRKKKRKRHHRRYRNQHAGGPKRGSSKRPLNTRGVINASAKKLHGNENSIIKRHQAEADQKSRHRPSVSKSNDKITAVKVEDSDYIDFSSPFITDSPVRSTKSHKNSGSVKLHDGESMVERLMRTTTRDPSKKSPGDQGIEYSDYYSEDDVLQDIVANKIPMAVAETRNPNDRFTRQTVNSTSYYNDNQIDRNVQPYYQDYDARGKGFRYTDDTTYNFQNYPILKDSGINRDSRLLDADDASVGYSPNYNPLDDRNENLAYPVNVDEIAGQPQIPEQIQDVSGVQNSLGVPDLNNVNNEVQPQDPDQFGYLNQYDVPQEGYSRNFDANEAQNLNLNGGREPQVENIGFSQNIDPIVEVPQFSSKFSVPEAQNLYSYRRAGTNRQHLGNIEQSVINGPGMGGMRLSSVKEEDADGHPRSNFRDQSLDSFPVQLKGNYHDNSNDSPSGNAPNAMDLPLGKVLESLGISVSTESSDLNQNSNSKELSLANSVMERNNNPVPVSESLDRPVEHVLSPSYIRKTPKEDLNRVYEGGNVRGLDHQALKPRNENSNVREGHTRRQSVQNGIQNNNLFMDEGKNDGHHMNISIAVHDTKEVASQILDTIMDELEELKFDPAKNNKREGSWSTAQAGMKLDMKVVNHSIIVTMLDLATPRFHESLLNGTWNVSGHAPFKRGSPFTLIATDNHTNSIAVFVGTLSVLYKGLHSERVCQGIDTIAGVWSVARQPKDCRDFQVATSVFNDIFRKTKLSSLKEKQNAASTAESTTTKKERKRS